MRLVVPGGLPTAYLAFAADRPAAGDTLTPLVAAPDPVEHADAAVLVPTGDLGAWTETHRAVTTAGVATGGQAGIALDTAVRPDLIDEPLIWMKDASTTARLLVRAVFERYYGVAVAGEASDASGANVVLVEGVEALGRPEIGHRDDLGRAWFILNGLPLVSHLLMAPADADPTAVAEAAGWLHATGGLDKDRRRKARERVAGAAGLDPAALIDVLAAVRTRLEPADLDTAKLLFQLARDPDHPTPSLTPFSLPDAEGTE